MKKIAPILLAVAFSACASMSHQQAADYDVWESQGKLIHEKSTVSAFWLGILPGGGSFYSRQYGAGILDLLLWPFSVLWDPGIGVAGAKKINFEATRYAMETGRIPNDRFQQPMPVPQSAQPVAAAPAAVPAPGQLSEVYLDRKDWAALPANQSVRVYSKSGDVYDGGLISTDDSYVWLTLADGGKKSLARSEIARMSRLERR